MNVAAHYLVYRSDHNGPPVPISSSPTPAFLDTGLVSNTTYVYSVTAVDASNTIGPASNNDIATTIVFTNDPVGMGSTIIQAVHVTELRTAVNATLEAAGHPALTFTDASLTGVVVKGVHVSELRSALNTARSLLALPVLVYTDPALAPGNIVKAAHLQELRNGVK